MIFLTMGTQEPFDRLVRAMDVWYGRSDRSHVLFGQIAEDRRARYEPVNFEWVARMSPVDYAAKINEADLIVSHAGMGSILTALNHGKPIVVMPRLAHLREHRNDHQMATVKQLRGRPGIHVADDEVQLGAVLDNVLGPTGGAQAAPISSYADRGFTDALRAFLVGPSENLK